MKPKLSTPALKVVGRRTIDSFTGEYAFLSNFFRGDRSVDLPRMPRSGATAEHVFQALKTEDSLERVQILKACSPATAKKLGRKCTLRPDWEETKIAAMREVLQAKFSDIELGNKLLMTGDAYLVEGNNWGDYFWGKVDGRGQNWLGRLLMEVRGELRMGRIQSEEAPPQLFQGVTSVAASFILEIHFDEVVAVVNAINCDLPPDLHHDELDVWKRCDDASYRRFVMGFAAEDCTTEPEADALAYISWVIDEE